MSKLRQRAISGIRWVALTAIVRRFLGFAIMVVLARLLSPADFGLYALAFVLIDALSLFQNLGMNAALIQRKDEEPLAADTAFWVFWAVGLVLFLGIQGCAPLFSRWMGDSDLLPLVRVLGFVFLIGSIGRVPLALLSKRIEFARREWAQISGEIVYALVAVTLALSGWKVWSLIAGYLVKTMVADCLAWRFAGWRPAFRFSGRLAKELFHVGGFLLASSLLVFVRQGMGNLLVGKLLGMTALGFYTISLGVTTFLNHHVFSKLHPVAFPVLARLQDERRCVQRAYLKLLKYTAIIAFPVAVGLVLGAEPFLQTVYGAKWLPAAPILKVLAFAGAMQSLTHPAVTTFYASGATRFKFFVDLVSGATFFLLVAPMTARWGAVGAGVALCIGNLFGLLVSLWGVWQVLELSPRDIGRALRVPVLGGCVLTLMMLLVKGMPLFFKMGSLSPLVHLFILALAGMSSYVVYLSAVEQQFWTDVKAFLR